MGTPGGRGTLATVKRIQQAAATGTWPHQLARLRRPRGISCSLERGATDASWIGKGLGLEQAGQGRGACVIRRATAKIIQNQFDALVDVVFNLGGASLSISQLLREVNSGNFSDAATQFLRWDHVKGVVVQGLLRRRQAEATLFNTPI